MTKRVFLYVSGDDYSAMDFSENYNAQKVYESMVKENLIERTIITDEHYIEIEIKEFGEIDDDFISFVWDAFVDYDDSKSKELFEVEFVEA